MKLQLSKNLRRDILRGHPWVYKNALKDQPKLPRAQLCALMDKHQQFLAWGYYDPHSPLAFRVLSLQKQQPTLEYFKNLMEQAWKLRNPLRTKSTNCYRLFNGEGDLLPGMVCDVYDNTAVLQFDGKGAKEFWDIAQVCQWLQQKDFSTVIEKSRMNLEADILVGTLIENKIVIENDIPFEVDILKGQKTGFFLDQRDNRQYVQSIALGKRALNLYSYTGGFSIAAGKGGATEVTSVDISPKAIKLAQQNWQLNQLQQPHYSAVSDVFEFLKSNTEKWELIVVDPPSMAANEKDKPAAIKKYQYIFAEAAKQLKPNGDLLLSSCSSHISFADFQEIITEALSAARSKGQILRVAGQGPDHPYPHACPHLRYLKFIHLVLN